MITPINPDGKELQVLEESQAIRMFADVRIANIAN
jgi:hypothetical protein